ncbi:hypothetical protein WJX72_003519 [[Myrmecia] bisecta]|uniref:Transcription initiation factor IIF subunit alpha n=1 Tax=[Myrmecia] bisecta TaxID=41462 RepID=A0AAW1QEP4_9CHLO
MAQASHQAVNNVQHQEYVVRAPGAAHTHSKFFIGKFPLGAPVFQDTGKSSWKLAREAQEAAPPNRRGANRAPPVAPWVLDGGAAQPTYRGTPEGGLTGNSAAGYFLLVKEGDDFVAVPVEGWYNFRPTARHKTMTLEEAEAAILRRQAGRDRAGPSTESRLGSFMETAPVEIEEEQGKVDLSSDDEPGSDDEERAKKATTANRGAKNGLDAADERVERANQDVEGDGGEKGEDWEHEQNNDDDDLNMGEDEEEEAVEGGPPAPRRRQSGATSDSDEENQHLTGEGKELKRLLNRSGLEDSDEEEAGGRGGGGHGGRGRPGCHGLGPPVCGHDPRGKASGRRRRGRALTAARLRSGLYAQPGTKRKAEAAAGSPPATDKKVKTEVKTEPVGAAATTSAPAPGGPAGVTEREVVNYLTATGPVLSSELSKHFKKRIQTAEQKKGLAAIMKRVGKLEEMPPGSGQKFIVLKKK